ncbi:MAG: hypothetical protein ABIH34_07380 [Nanoarchaeota archaeon]
MKKIKDCIREALADEKKGKKHRGLLITTPDQKIAKEYIEKAKMNLGLCDTLKNAGYDYKIPEEWFYTLYYCALAVLAKFGVESRNQACTAAFLQHVKKNNLIEYDDEFIERIWVLREKDEISDVDKRENARYSPATKIAEVESRYGHMTLLCKRAISQAEDIIYAKNQYAIPKELTTFIPT